MDGIDRQSVWNWCWCFAWCLCVAFFWDGAIAVGQIAKVRLGESTEVAARFDGTGDGFGRVEVFVEFVPPAGATSATFKLRRKSATSSNELTLAGGDVLVNGQVSSAFVLQFKNLEHTNSGAYSGPVVVRFLVAANLFWAGDELEGWVSWNAASDDNAVYKRTGMIRDDASNEAEGVINNGTRAPGWTVTNDQFGDWTIGRVGYGALPVPVSVVESRNGNINIATFDMQDNSDAGWTQTYESWTGFPDSEDMLGFAGGNVPFNLGDPDFEIYSFDGVKPSVEIVGVNSNFVSAQWTWVRRFRITAQRNVAYPDEPGGTDPGGDPTGEDPTGEDPTGEDPTHDDGCECHACCCERLDQLIARADERNTLIGYSNDYLGDIETSVQSIETDVAYLGSSASLREASDAQRNAELVGIRAGIDGLGTDVTRSADGIATINNRMAAGENAETPSAPALENASVGVAVGIERGYGDSTVIGSYDFHLPGGGIKTFKIDPTLEAYSDDPTLGQYSEWFRPLRLTLRTVFTMMFSLTLSFIAWRSIW